MAKNIVTAQVTLSGTRPLFWHWFGPDAIPLEKVERTGVAGNDPEEWKKTYLATSSGQLYVTGSYAFSTLKNGAAYTKRGKGSIMKLVASTLQILDEVILVDRYMPDPIEALADMRDPTLPVYLDVRSVVNPSTKGRNVRYRVAASPGWTMTFGIQWDKTVVSRPEMETVTNDSGLYVGIGNGRNIGMGRFEVVSFKVLDFDLAETAELTALSLR